MAVGVDDVQVGEAQSQAVVFEYGEGANGPNDRCIVDRADGEHKVKGRTVVFQITDANRNGQRASEVWRRDDGLLVDRVGAPR